MDVTRLPVRFCTSMLAVLTLALVAGPGWWPAGAGVGAGSSHGGGSPVAASEASAADIDAAGVVERVRHRIAARPGRPGVLTASDDAYRAGFDDGGFSLAPPKGRGNGLVVSLRSLARGGRPVNLGVEPWRGEENVARRSVAPGVIEQVTARDGELEWDVVLDRPLPGPGDVRVEADVSGTVGDPRVVGDTVRYHMADGQVIRMGELVVVDAVGTELYRALPAAAPGRLALDVPAAVLDGAAYPLTLDPTVGPERPVVTAPSEQTDPAAATAPAGEDPADTLVVWADGRGGQYDIRAAVVLANGTLRHPDGLAITTTYGIDEGDPAVTWIPGSGFLVVWERRDRDTPANVDIWGVRVGNYGGSVGTPVTVTNTGDQETNPAVASNGSDAVVVWEVNASSVTGARVDGTGSVQAYVDVGGSGTQRTPAIAWSVSRYFVVWHSNNTDIRGARLYPNGSLASNVTVSVAAGTQSRPQVAWNGSRFLVAWQDTRNGKADIFGSRVTNLGTVQDPAGFSIATAGASYGLFSPAVVAKGSDFVVAWADQPEAELVHDVYGARVADDGSVLDPSGILISAAEATETIPVLAPTEAATLVLWHDQRWGHADIYGARVDADGDVLDPAGIAVSTAARDQAQPAVAFDGTNFLVVWRDGHIPPWDIHGARVGRDGTILGGEGFVIGTNEIGGNPAVAWSGSQFLVVWESFPNGENDFDIRGARVSRTGGVVDQPFPVVALAGDERDPEVTWVGSSFLVVWEDSRNGIDLDLFANRVSSSGAVLDGPGGKAVASAAGDQKNADVVAQASNALVVWEDERTGSASDDIRAAQVASGGVIGSSFVVSGATGRQENPAVAWNGNRYLVIWRDLRAGGAFDLYATRVTSTGTVQDPAGIAVSTDPATQTDPDVAAHGPTFLVAWRDSRHGFYDLYATTVSDGGAVQDTAGFALNRGGPEEGAPALTDAPGGWAVSYERPISVSAPDRGALFRTVSPK